MKCVLQRVTRAKVTVDHKVLGKTDKGFMILFCAVNDDTEEHLNRMCDKIANLRVFADENGKMNKSIKDIGGSILLISQFTLCADCRKGRRPSFISSAPVDLATHLYDKASQILEQDHGIHCECGQFGADMQVELVNDGPVTIILDTKEFM